MFKKTVVLWKEQINEKKKFEVSLEGVFCKEFYISAETPEEAKKLAKKLFHLIGLSNEDYVINSSTITQISE